MRAEETELPRLGAGRITILALLFFISGACGLVYEVVWSKRLELIFGSTTYSIGVVLAAYMAGLGVGAWALGRLADRPGHPMRRYALLEIAIGVYGLAAPFLLDGVEWIYVALGGAGGLWLKATLGFLTVLPATLLMGGTLPVLARPLVRERAHVQRAVGMLYGINTLGAVAGAALAGLVLVSWLGMDVASRATGLVNIALGVLVLVAAKNLVPAVEEPAAEAVGADEVAHEGGGRRWVTIAAATTFGCGAVALAMEVAWTRALTLAFGATEHAFTIVLAATLLGIGLGSLVAIPLRRLGSPLEALCRALVLLVAASCVFLYQYERLPALIFSAAQPRYLYYEQLLALFFGASTLALLPATLALGIAFPLSVQLGAQAAERTGRSVGRLYLANTAGAILGSLAGSFLLVPWIGAQGVVRLGTVLASAGLLALVFAGKSWAGWRVGQVLRLGATGLVFLVLSLVAPRWDTRLLDLDPVRKISNVDRQPGSFRHHLRRAGPRQIYAREGLNAYVTVRSDGRNTTLALGGKVDASNVEDMPTQILLGTVPFLAKPDASRVLVVGAGSGVTLRVAHEFPLVTQLDLVEIEEAVIEAARLHFTDVNHGVLEEQGVNIIYEDARTFLIASPGEPYDVIISEPTNPSIAGVANLFTLEHYENARERLTEDGVYLQWIQLYEADDWMGRSMLRTFLEAFPYADAWASEGPDVLMLGSNQPLQYDRGSISSLVESNPGLSRDLQRYLDHQTADDLLSRHLLGRDQLMPLVSGGTVLRDRVPILAGHAARVRYDALRAQVLMDEIMKTSLDRARLCPPNTVGAPGNTALRTAAARHLVRVLPQWARYAVGQLEDPTAFLIRARTESTTELSEMVGLLNRGLKLAPNDPELLIALAEAYAAGGQPSQVGLTLRKIRPEQRNARYYLVRAHILSAQDPNRVAALRASFESLEPRDLEFVDVLLSLTVQSAIRQPDALVLLRELADAEPDDRAKSMALASALYQRGSFEESQRVVEDLMDRNDLYYFQPARMLQLEAAAAQEGVEVRGLIQGLIRDYPDFAMQTEFTRFIRMLRE